MSIWRTARFLVGMKRPVELNHTPGLKDQFLDACFLSSGRNLALAASFLPVPLYRAARTAFLVARALDGIEDLSAGVEEAKNGMHSFIRLLSGAGGSFCYVPSLRGRRAVERTEAVLLANAPLLAIELNGLAPAARAPILHLARTMAEGMLRHYPRAHGGSPAETRSYAGAVLGAAVRCALDVTGLHPGVLFDVEAIAVALQAANDLRDLSGDGRALEVDDQDARRLSLKIEALRAAPTALTSIERLEFNRLSRRRAALALIVAATAKHIAQSAGATPQGLLRRPRLAAFYSLVSGAAFRELLVCVDNAIVTAALADSTSKPTAAIGASARVGSRLQAAYDAKLIAARSDGLRAIIVLRALSLARLTARLSASLWRCSLDDAHTQSATAVLACDYLLACALHELQPLGSRTVIQFADFLRRSAQIAEVTAPGRRWGQEATMFVAEILGDPRAEQHGRTSARLGQIDRCAIPLLSTLRRHLARKQLHGGAFAMEFSQ